MPASPVLATASDNSRSRTWAATWKSYGKARAGRWPGSWRGRGAALAGGGAGRGDRRRDVVEEAVVLVVVQDEDGLGPDLGVGGQRGDQPSGQIGAVRGRGVGMLAELVGRHDPGHPRQAVGGHVLGE